MRSDIVPGAAFPDYELPDHTNTLRKFSQLQGDDPLILPSLFAAEGPCFLYGLRNQRPKPRYKIGAQA